MMLKSPLHRNDKGIGAVEFALIAPVLISFIVGVSQLGRMFYANADMKNASAHAARLASVYREGAQVDDATLVAAVKARLLRDGAESKVTVTVNRGTDNGNPFVELKTDYSVPLEFIFFNTPPVTLHDTRRVYTQVASANSTTITTTSSTSSTSATSAGGTTSSTSATSASSTSASSTSSGTTSTTSSGTTSSTTSSTSSGSNASSGSNNGSSGKHDHGDCKNNCK